MPRRAFRVAYDGRPHHGFQRQPDVPTVEDALLAGLRRLDVAPDDGTPSGYAAAGRTDAGVSALAQTVAFDAPEWLTPGAMNPELPDTIRVWAVATVPDDFHATHDATDRTYTYFLLSPTVALDRARVAADRLAGRNDYHNLTPDADGTTRELEIDVGRDGDVLVVTVTADGFPRHLVRRLVTLLDRVSRGKAPPATIDRVLSAEPLDGPDGVPPAPPYPLVLVDVAYPGISFRRATADSAADVFAGIDREYRARARVAARIADGIEPPTAAGDGSHGKGNH